jgi:hypothetical protein
MNVTSGKTALSLSACLLIVISSLFWVRLLPSTSFEAEKSSQPGPANPVGINQLDHSEATLGKPHFELGTECALCHDSSANSRAQRDSQGRNVAAYDLWQSSMMAQSSRDPYWRAVLSAEVLRTPNQKAHLEEICTKCHAPMAGHFPAGPEGQVLSLLQADTVQAQLGLDGVSCTVCHQITEKNLGSEKSFTGNFEIGLDSKIFGPHLEPVTMPMQRHVGYTPTHSPHILKSSLCATCHTVITQAVTSDGKATGVHFHEQSPYLEWRNSVFNDELPKPDPAARSCQSCHLPTADVDGNRIQTTLAHNPGGRNFPFLKPREFFGRHTLVGGNALMTRILRDHAEELGVDVPKAAFDASLEQIGQMLRYQTATLQIGKLEVEGSQLNIPITVTNLAGHKFPTAYPSRRAWIRLRVLDSNSKIVFASGEFNGQGELVDSDGEVLSSEKQGGSYLPHFEQIETSRQVQVYESLMANVEGEPTFYLLHGAKFLKDNRLLPRGWRVDHADGPATEPSGIHGDSNFTGGSDQLEYRVPIVPGNEYRVEASLLFQTLSPRHAAELFANDTPEVEKFRAMYHAADRRPERIDIQSSSFPNNKETLGPSQ